MIGYCSTKKEAYKTTQIELKGKNQTHVLVITHNQIKFTKAIVFDLLKNHASFDLTLFDNGSDDNEGFKFYDYLRQTWNREDCSLNIVLNDKNSPINHVWNWFVEHTESKYVAIFNNDMRVGKNIIGNAEKIFQKDNKIGMIIHPTNVKLSEEDCKVEYVVNETPVLQGWDMIFRRNAYLQIPEDLLVWSGDNWLVQSIICNGFKQVYDVRSTITHYTSQTIGKYSETIKLQKDHRIFMEKYYKKVKISTADSKYLRRAYNGKPFRFIDEEVIVSMTTYPSRISNIPTVLDSLLNQTVKPYRIVINLSVEEYKNKELSVPEDILKYIQQHSDIIELFFVEGKNRKVWKKIIPTMLRYKNHLILSVDDDFIYPSTMIEDFLEVYTEDCYNPISGNKEKIDGMNAHCGCSSLVKYDFMKGFIENLSDDLFDHCPASDLYYTFVVNQNGFHYNRTKNKYFHNLKSYNTGKGYSSIEKVGVKRKQILKYLHSIFTLDKNKNNNWLEGIKDKTEHHNKNVVTNYHKTTNGVKRRVVTRHSVFMNTY